MNRRELFRAAVAGGLAGTKATFVFGNGLWRSAWCRSGGSLYFIGGNGRMWMFDPIIPGGPWPILVLPDISSGWRWHSVAGLPELRRGTA